MKNLIIFFSMLFSFNSYSQISFNPYVSQLPINQMAQIGIYKQQLYDSRKDLIQKNVTVIATNIDEFSIGEHLGTEKGLKELPDEPGTYISNGVVERLNKKHRLILKNYCNSINTADFTNDYLFQSILNRLKKMNADVLEDLSPLLK